MKILDFLRVFVLMCVTWMTLHVSAETVTYFIPDVNGSPMAAMDESGRVLWRESYDPYGKGRNNPSQNSNDVGFTGHQKDDATELTYMQARYFDAVVGRFYGVDPVGATEHLASGNIQGFNRYNYAYNNPQKFVDPDGRIPILIPVFVFVAKEVAGEVFEQTTGIPAPTVKNLGKVAVKQFLKSSARGRASEKRVLKKMGLEKNNDKVSSSEGNSIPDALTDTMSVEVKDVKNVSLTKQLRIQTQSAKENGKTSVLVVTDRNEKISGPAKEAFDVIVKEKDLN